MSKIHFCDICNVDMSGERIHLLDLHHYNDEAKRLPSIPLMELCPTCKEWVKECITMRKEKCDINNQQEVI